MDKLEPVRKNDKTWLCEVLDLNLHALADFTALNATNDHCPFFNSINGASTGFFSKSIWFALCKTWINGEKFLDGEFFIFFFPFWLVAPTCWYYWANQICVFIVNS